MSAGWVDGWTAGGEWLCWPGSPSTLLLFLSLEGLHLTSAFLSVRAPGLLCVSPHPPSLAESFLNCSSFLILCQALGVPSHSLTQARTKEQEQ